MEKCSELCKLFGEVVELHRERFELIEKKLRMLKRLMEKTFAFDCSGASVGDLTYIYRDYNEGCSVLIFRSMLLGGGWWEKCTITILCSNKSTPEAMLWLIDNADKVADAVREYVRKLGKANREVKRKLELFEKMLHAIMALQ